MGAIGKTERLRAAMMLIIVCLSGIYAQSSEPLNLEDARIWCDSVALSPVEGIWEYPEDGTTVLISADKGKHGSYKISVLSTPDCRLERGDVIGRLHSSADSRQFRLEQMTRKKSTLLQSPQECAATLSTDGETLKVKGKKVKIRIQPYTLLPRFWRIVRVTEKNPVEDLPAGLIKVYPGYDHNGSLRRKPRIL